MKKFIVAHKEFLITLLLSLILLWPLFVSPSFTYHDDVQVIRLYEMDKCIKDGQIPCRWVPDLGGLYGYPLFNYYAPLPYYFGELFYLVTNNLLISVKIMFATSFIGSVIFMYLFARRFWGELGGTISALFYAYAPYHALDFYVRGAMGEMWGLMAFPLILWSLVKLAEKQNILNTLLTILSLSVLFLSHNLSTMIFFPIILLFIVVLYYRSRNHKLVFYFIAAFMLSFFLSAFYLLPMATERHLVHEETTTYGYFHYTEHFKGIRKLFLERMWGWGASVREVPGGERDGMSFQIGWVHLLGWALSIVAAWHLWNKKRYASLLIILFSAIALVSVFLIHPRSEFIWRLIPPLEYLQFPWRFLMLIILSTSFLSGSIFTLVKNKKVWWVMVILVVLFNFSYFRPERFLSVTDSELLTGAHWDKQIKRSIYDYLPIFAKEPPAELAESPYEILTGEAQISNFMKGTDWINFDIDVKEHTILRLSQYYFPEWIVKIDGKEANIDYENNNLGLMTLIIGEGKHQVEAYLQDTPIRIISNWMTVAGFSGLVLLFLLQFKQVQNWIKYYVKRIG